MSKIPQTDSVTELGRFWDSHDLTEFEDELEDVNAKVFNRGCRSVVREHLRPEEAAAQHRIAKSGGPKT